MAKRKRLTPARNDYLAAPAAPRPAPGPLSSAPIAQVAGEASATAALSELGEAMRAAREEGRLIEALPLEAIDEAYLVRDRLVQDNDDMTALVASIDSRGQQTPIEVVALPDARGGKTHGLISGWRRLTAFRRLYKGSGEARFATIRARVVAPESMQAAYVAMVEENEIRANLSHYERARIALRAWHEGIYPTQKVALQGLFESVSRSKRSKIGSFMPLVEALDRVLRFPTLIPEKLGLDLSRALQADAGFAARLQAALADPAETPEEELSRLTRALAAEARRPAVPPVAGKAADPVAPVPGQGDPVVAAFDTRAGAITLTGRGVDKALYGELRKWLKARG